MICGSFKIRRETVYRSNGWTEDTTNTRKRLENSPVYFAGDFSSTVGRVVFFARGRLPTFPLAFHVSAARVFVSFLHVGELFRSNARQRHVNLEDLEIFFSFVPGLQRTFRIKKTFLESIPIHGNRRRCGIRQCAFFSMAALLYLPYHAYFANFSTPVWPLAKCSSSSLSLHRIR